MSWQDYQPDCDGQAADAIPAYTQVKMEDAPRLFRIPKSECPDVWIRLPRHKCPNHGQTLKVKLFLLNEIYSDIHLLVEDTFMELGW